MDVAFVSTTLLPIALTTLHLVNTWVTGARSVTTTGAGVTEVVIAVVTPTGIRTVTVTTAVVVEATVTKTGILMVATVVMAGIGVTDAVRHQAAGEAAGTLRNTGAAGATREAHPGEAVRPEVVEETMTPPLLPLRRPVQRTRLDGE